MPQDWESVRDESVAVGTSDLEIIPSNQARQEIILVNTSPAGQVITLVRGSKKAVAGGGMVLYPGGTYSASNSAGFRVYMGPWHGIASAAGGTLGVSVR